MHDAQAIILTLHVAQIIRAAMIDERIHERAVVVIDGRMTHETRLLRQHDEMLVLVADIEIDRLPRHRPGRRRVLYLEHDGVACGHGVLLGHRGAVDVHGSLVHGPSGRTAAGIQSARGEERVEAQPRVSRVDDMAQKARHRASDSPGPGAAWASARSPRCHESSMPARNRTNPHVTPMSATLNTGKSMNTGSIKSTT